MQNEVHELPLNHLQPNSCSLVLIRGFTSVFPEPSVVNFAYFAVKTSADIFNRGSGGLRGKDSTIALQNLLAHSVSSKVTQALSSFPSLASVRISAFAYLAVKRPCLRFLDFSVWSFSGCRRGPDSVYRDWMLDVRIFPSPSQTRLRGPRGGPPGPPGPNPWSPGVPVLAPGSRNPM